MRVLLINGSPNAEGCTFTALSEVAATLNAEGIDTEIYQLGKRPVNGCTVCGACHKLDNRCAFGDDDGVNAVISKLHAADGVVIGSPVYFAGANGNLCSLLDRVFFAGGGYAGKPGAAVVSARRGGTGSAFDRINKYFTIAQMPIVSSQYWNNVHGSCAGDVRKDLEGMQTMRTLGRNMAWLLKCIDAGRKSGIDFPQPERPRAITNFIR